MADKIESAADDLLKAAGRYVDALGGKAVVAGGIRIEQWPEDAALNFRVSVKITGQLPPARADTHQDSAP